MTQELLDRENLTVEDLEKIEPYGKRRISGIYDSRYLLRGDLEIYNRFGRIAQPKNRYEIYFLLKGSGGYNSGHCGYIDAQEVIETIGGERFDVFKGQAVCGS